MDRGTSEVVKRGNGYVHPDYPERTIEQLEADAAQFNLDVHLVALLFHEPFYADIIRSLHKEATKSISTAGVLYRDGTMRMWWNPLFVAAYPPMLVRGILKHEALHLVLEHTTTRRYVPHKIWNIACDLAINCLIPEAESLPMFLLPGRPLKKPADFATWPEDSKAIFIKVSKAIQNLPKNLYAEEYFTILMADPELQDWVKGNSNITIYFDGNGNLNFDDHEGWDALSEEEREYVQNKIRELVKDAQETADAKNSWGSVPVEIREEIRKRVRGEIPWRSVLRQFMGVLQRADRLSSVMRLHKKYPGIHPGNNRDCRPRVGCFIDQSGSMSDEEIALCFGELAGLSHRLEITVYNFDCTVDVQSKKVWKKGQPVPRAVRTRSGGTDFESVTRFVNKECKDNFEAFFILTDGQADRPSPSRVRRAWVLTPGNTLAFQAEPNDVSIFMKNSKGR